MQQLTKAEEEVMQVLWKIEQGFLKDIVEGFSKPKPAPTTVSTMLKILENKGFVTHETFGKAHRYAASVTKEEYSKSFVKDVMKKYFDNSLPGLVSFFAKSGELSSKEVKEIMQILEQKKRKKS